MIIRADKSHAEAVTELALRLWPDNDRDELLSENRAILEDDEAAVFLCEADGRFAGFAHCALRYDYVEGTDSSPVGYLEGIYVDDEFHGRGIARSLLKACESWSAEMGCAEFASDCEADNAASIEFHMKTGFTEANRIICFTKRL